MNSFIFKNVNSLHFSWEKYPGMWTQDGPISFCVMAIHSCSQSKLSFPDCFFLCCDYEPSSQFQLHNFSQVNYSAESGCFLSLKLGVNDCFSFMKEFCSELKAYYIHIWFKGLLKQVVLSLKGCEELQTEIIPNFRLWAFFLCPTSEFSSYICVATRACSLFWLLLWFFFFLLCCDLFSSLCLVLVAASLLLPSLHCSDCSLCRDLHLSSQHCAGVSSGLIKRDVSEMFVLSAAEDAATVSDFLLLIKC